MGRRRDIRSPRRWVSPRAVAGLLVALLALAAAPAIAQEASPVATTPTPPPDLLPTREQVIAQGLAVFDVEPAVWRVTEVVVPRFADAESIAGDVSFTLQREGVSVIRNDVTLKRARLEVGEAYFMSAEDPYTRYAVGSDESRAWVIEFVDPAADDDDAGGEVIFKSDPVENFPGGARDLELIRNVLLPGEAADLPSHRGSAVVLVTRGAVEIAAGDAATTLNARQGILIPGDVFLRNTTDAPAIYVVVAIGASVSDPGEEDDEPAADETAEPEATATPEPTEGPTATPDTSPTGDPDGDGLNNDDETAQGTDPNNPDSDGDLLKDGTEVTTTNTDPLEPDSDGDGASDGDEALRFGTNPNDPNSKP